MFKVVVFHSWKEGLPVEFHFSLKRNPRIRACVCGGDGAREMFMSEMTPQQLSVWI